MMKSPKHFKLKIHQHSFSDEQFIFNGCDVPEIKLSDLVKVYAYDCSSSNYLLFQVKTIKDTVLPKDTVSVEQNLANSIGFQPFQSVYVLQVEPEDVSIDLLEVSFKDQYISRSDMWRMKKHLVKSCAYIDQYLQFSDIRAQVSELWVNSNKARCGYINDNTNFVLRSYTAKVYVFIQMSSEMWEYDAYGYLQFERAIDGFLKALFTKWKEKKCCHELTLVLFSRTFYETDDIRDFPITLQDAVRENYRGQLYLDFYKCVVQTEKLEDCIPLLSKLKKLFHKYDELTHIAGCPGGKNSTSSEGNFLEAINMSLNVFEHHTIDRNFDGTGQIVVCITPGVGVFDVDRDLTILTKERMIDNGIGSDLICLGQQPLHAVPLFKFHHKSTEWSRVSKSQSSSRLTQRVLKPPQQDFNIPHWINHSFYTSNPFPDKGTTNIKYVPRIHVPVMKSKSRKTMELSPFSSKSVDAEELPNVQQFSYAEYDKRVFEYQKPASWKQPHQDSRSTPKRVSSESYKKKMKTTEDRGTHSPDNKALPTRPVHIPLTNTHGFLRLQDGLASSLGAGGHLDKQFRRKNVEGLEVRPVIGSATTTRTSFLDDGAIPTQVSRRALFNPFNPSHMFAPLTANRRRWVHTYPRGPQGEALVLHHQNSYLSRMGRQHQDSESTDDEGGLVLPMAFGAISSPASSIATESPSNTGFIMQHTIHASFEESNSLNKTSSLGNTSHKGTPIAAAGDNVECNSSESFSTFKGLDWKSLKCPACLPITTDYCPTESRLQNAYTEHSYTLVPDDANFNSDHCNNEELRIRHDSSDRECRSAREVFLELINQRLCQGFQIIKKTKRFRNTDSSSSCATITSPNPSEGSFRSLAAGASPMFPSSYGAADGDKRSDHFMLSHGRQYHVCRLSPEEDKIEVKIYRPRHPFTTATVEYNYMLWPKTRSQFQVAKTSFAHEKVEDYYWNHFDDYVCYPDDNGFQLRNLKCWKTKFVVICSPSKRLNLLKTANENNGAVRYDVFDGCGCKKSHENALENGECAALTEGFIRFLEHLNKFKRKDTQRKSWKSFHSFTGNLSKSYPASSSSLGLHSSNHATPTPPTRPTSSTPSSECSTPVRFPSESANNGAPPQFSGSLLHGVDAQPVPIKGGNSMHVGLTSPSRSRYLTINSEMSDVVSAMKNSQNGLSFLPEQNGVPKLAFVGLEAVHWAIENIEGIYTIEDACDHLERIRSYGFFIHVSHDPTVTFVYGYYLYSIRDEQQHFELEDPTSYQYHSYNTGPSEVLQNRWFEVAVKRQDLDEEKLCSRHHLSTSNAELNQEPSSAFYVRAAKREKTTARFLKNKLVKLSLMNKMRTNRTEWCHFKYSPFTAVGYHNFVFCFELQWMVATATCLFNMFQVWFREAARCDLYFFPVPCQPFAFPRSGVNGPLRSPLFVPLNLHDLVISSVRFKEFKQRPDEYRDMVLAMMEAILLRFGFLRDQSDDDGSEDRRSESLSQNYIHCTGQVLAQIPVRYHSVQRNSISLRQRPEHNQFEQSPVTQTELDATGFYWTFNYMQTKRWRTPALDDCPPADLQRDFVQFCANTDSRLIDFYESFITLY